MFVDYLETIFCPMCKEYREEWAKGSGENYYIKGHGENIYYKETCSLCGKSYYILDGNNGIVDMRIKGVPLEETIKILQDKVKVKAETWYKRIGLKRFENKVQDRIDEIVSQCKIIYEMDENDLIIPAELVKPEDLTIHSCWIS